MKVVVVAFRVAEENAVYYRKREILMDEGKFARGAGVDEALGAMLVNAFEKGADFVSVRFVRTEPGRVILEEPKSKTLKDYHPTQAETASFAPDLPGPPPKPFAVEHEDVSA